MKLKLISIIALTGMLLSSLTGYAQEENKPQIIGTLVGTVVRSDLSDEAKRATGEIISELKDNPIIVIDAGDTKGLLGAESLVGVLHLLKRVEVQEKLRGLKLYIEDYELETSEGDFYGKPTNRTHATWQNTGVFIEYVLYEGQIQFVLIGISDETL